MKCLLIIPAYNEAKNIPSVVQAVKTAGYDYVIINDGSSDETERLCEEHGVNVINLSKNLGIGGAVQTGYRFAKERGYDVDIQFDGDGQHDVSCVPALLKEIEKGADLVIGSRFIKETDGFQSTAMRRMGIKWLKHLIKRFGGIEITDATSGFRASGKRAIDLFCEYYPSDYPEPESIVFAKNAGLSVKEVPVVMHERQGGSSSIGGLSSVYYMIKVSLAIIGVRLARKKR